MDYAQNLHHAELPAHLIQWLTMPVTEANQAKWLLFDAAMIDEKSTVKLIKKLGSIPTYNVFSSNEFAIYGLNAPHLIRLDNIDPHKQHEVLHILLNITNGLPAFAVLDASADVGQISQYLSWLAQVHTSDGLELYCRFADTRITSVLLDTLNAQQHAILTLCIQQWLIINRFGILESLLPHQAHIPNQANAMGVTADVNQALVLSDTQYVALMNAAEADELFQILYESMSDLVPEENRGQFHQRLLHFIHSAHQRGIQNTADLLQFCVVGLTTQEHFYLHPILNETWIRITQKTANFSALVTGWSDDIWEALMQAIPAAKHQ